MAQARTVIGLDVHSRSIVADSEGLDGRFEPHPLNPIVSDVRRARPPARSSPSGATLLRHDDRLPRVAGGRRAPGRTAGRLHPHVQRERQPEAVDALRLVPWIGPWRGWPPATVALRITAVRDPPAVSLPRCDR